MKRLFISTCILGATLSAAAIQPIPLDPAVRTGQLPNGLTYYIRHNNSPEGQADFFIAQRVGSINEEENQRGLAHFLEHMCFNGTEHFPQNTLIEYLESLGVKFGKNLNAYTSTDETVYNICQVPTSRESALDSCVMILSDWSGRLLLEKDDIDAERGVIKGEMRQRSSPGSRILTAVAPTIYQDGIYGNRMPIGLTEIIDNFDPEDLRAYYRKWYHPANQAVIVVGDVDVDKIEESIRRNFSDIAAGPESVTATKVEVADNPLPIVATGTDPEQANNMIQLYVKEPLLPDSLAGTIEEVRRDYIRALVCDMLVERFDALEETPDCPWTGLGIGLQKFLLSGTRNALMLRATAFDAENTRRAISTLDTELLRAALHGFTDTELQRAKLSERSKMNTDYANAEAETNTDMARKYVKHFIRGGVVPSAEQYYKMMKGVERTTSLEDVNRYFADMVKPDGRNRITTIYAAAKDAEALQADVIKRDAESIDIAAITPFVDTFANTPLLADIPLKGSIVSEKDAPFGSRELTLSNGIKVYLRHNDAKPDEVLVHAVSPGGFSMNYDPAKKALYKMTDDALAASGFGGHSSTGLRKLLAGHSVKSAVKIGNTNEELIAVTTPSDLETALQLLYIKATSPNRDDNAFGALMASTRSKLENPNRTATFAMGDSIHAIVYNRHPLGEKLYPSELDKVDYDSILAIHADRFGDMSDFTYIITGNFNNDEVKALVEKYIASLPGNGRQEKPQDIGYGFFKGEGAFSYTYPMESTPQSITYSFFNGECPYDLEHILMAQTFGSIVKSRLMAEVREKRGLTYGINSHCSVTTGFNSPDTPSRFIMPVYIKVEPGHEEEVFGVVRSTISDLSTDGPTPEEVGKVKAFLAKEIADNRTDNGYWETVIKVYDQFGQDMDSDYEAILDRMTPETIRDFGKTYLTGADHVEISMRPE
ncbi:MAG: insulinase family protein [Muribaculaceae bacterium]|nr:insulinase family protein [Muribaculaceae bacterium]